MFSSFSFFLLCHRAHRYLHSFPTRRSSDLLLIAGDPLTETFLAAGYTLAHDLTTASIHVNRALALDGSSAWARSEEHTSELQSLRHLVCRLLLEKKKKQKIRTTVMTHTQDK